MKRKRFLAGCLAMVMCLTACQQADSKPDSDTPVNSGTAETEENHFNPGTYRVEMMAHNAPITVDVTFSEDKIEDIVVVEHKESKSLGDWAMEMTSEEILERQSLDVDVVAGATVSSAALRAAVRTAVGDAGGNVSALMVKKEENADPLPDENVDVVVVGAGGAGLAAAVSALENGLNVMLIEQLGVVGGSTARSGGLIASGTKAQEAYGQDYDTDLMRKILNAEVSANYDPGLFNAEYVEGFAERAANIVNWLYDMGVTFGEPWPYVEGVPQSLLHMGDNSSRISYKIVEVLRDKLIDNNVELRTNTKALKLVQEGDKVTGVLVEAPNGTNYTIYADNVILATGGFLANKEMVAQYKPGYENNNTDVSMGDDGSGILMAQEVDAAVSCMDSFAIHPIAATYNGASRGMTMPLSQGAIMINEKGERFTNEAGSYTDVAVKVLEQETAYAVIDAQLMSSAAIQNDIGLSSIEEMYTVGNTPEELAEKLGIDPATIKKTIETYTEYVRNGEDKDFGKSAGSMKTDYSEGPYYAVAGMPENHTSYGGVKTDIKIHVLREDGTVIDGLYAVGEVACFMDYAHVPLTTCFDTALLAIQDIVETKK